MKAAVLRQFSQPFQLEEREIPKIGSGQILVQVTACGVCGTDVKLWQGKKPEVELPRVIGHEIAGKIVSCAQDVTHLKIGDRGVISFYNNCNRCEYCATNRESLCEQMEGRLGFTLDGGMEEFIAVRAENFLKVPDNIPLEKACIVSDAVATAYRGLKKAGMQPGNRVLVVGLGGLGVHAAQLAAALGGEVFGIDVDNKKLEFANQYGIKNLLLFSKDPQDTVKRIMDLSRGIDIVVETVNRSETLSIDLQVLRLSGKLLMLGYGTNVTLPNFPIVRKEITILGSRGSSRQDIKEALDLVAQNKVQFAVSRTYPLTDLTTALENLQRGDVLGRQVIILHDEHEPCHNLS